MAAPPELGRANEAVLRLLAETLSLPRRQVTLLSGRGRREKVVELEGLGRDEAIRRLEAAL